MKNQVLTKEQMRELIDMGVDVSKTSCCWCKVKATNKEGFDWMLLPEHLDKCDEEHVPTFTIQDILNQFDTYSIKDFSGDVTLEVYYKGNWVQSIDGDKLLDIAFQMLKWCKENGYI